VRKEFPAAPATQLKALGCEGFEWGGESRVIAQKPLTDQTLAQVAELVADLPNLGLYLDSSRLTDEGVSSLRRLGNLRSLRLSGGGVTDAGLAHVAELGRLERLYLLNNERITDAGLVHLGQMSRLKELTSSGSKVTNQGLLHLKGLENLEKLLIEPLLANVEQVPELHDALFVAGNERGAVVQVVDVATGRVQLMCPAETTWSPAVMFSADGAVAALVEHRRVLLLDTESGALLQEIRTSQLDGEEDDFVTSRAALSPDGGRIALARRWARLYALHVLDAHTKKVIARFSEELGRPWDLRFSADGERLLVMSTPVYLWDLTSGEITAQFQPAPIDTAHHEVAFSPDEQKAAIATSREVQLWDIANQACETHWNRERSYLYVRGIFFDRSGSLLVLSTPGPGDSPLAARLHDAATGRLVGKLDFPVEIVPSTLLTLAPDGRRVAYQVRARQQEAHGVGGQIHVCDLFTAELLTVVQLPKDHFLHGLAFTPDGDRLIVHSWSPKLHAPGHD
jgi:hypothetical protein